MFASLTMQLIILFGLLTAIAAGIKASGGVSDGQYRTVEQELEHTKQLRAALDALAQDRNN